MQITHRIPSLPEETFSVNSQDGAWINATKKGTSDTWVSTVKDLYKYHAPRPPVTSEAMKTFHGILVSFDSHIGKKVSLHLVQPEKKGGHINFKHIEGKFEIITSQEISVFEMLGNLRLRHYYEFGKSPELLTNKNLAIRLYAKFIRNERKRIKNLL